MLTHFNIGTHWMGLLGGGGLSASRCPAQPSTNAPRCAQTFLIARSIISSPPNSFDGVFRPGPILKRELGQPVIALSQNAEQSLWLSGPSHARCVDRLAQNPVP